MIEFTQGKPLSDIDPLSGCGNLTAFTRRLKNRCSNPNGNPYSLVIVDINSIRQINDTKGHTEGDRTIRWVAQLVGSELNIPIFRIGGDKFLGMLENEGYEQHEEMAFKLFEAMNRQGNNTGLPVPIASVSVIKYFGNEKFTPKKIFAHIFDSIQVVKEKHKKTIGIFTPDDLSPDRNEYAMGGIICGLDDYLDMIGDKVEQSLQLAFTDPITNLPNQRSAQVELSKLGQSSAKYSVIFIDGDDLHQYNKISIIAGDEMIKNLGQLIRQTIRPIDFLARWRVGDEFIVLLKDTDEIQGLIIAERLCRTIENETKGWVLPVTISIGVSTFPEHGLTPEEIVHGAELANAESKRNGKNRVTLYTL
jgi:diguanylate cyclase (GGDEF)-like protein